MSEPVSHHRPTNPNTHKVAAAVWLLVGLGSLAIQILLLWLFQPEKGLLPSPSWLTDPIAGFVVGFVIGAIAYKVVLHSTPWAITAVALVAVALAPVIFVKYAALGAFVAAVAIGLATGALWRRAASNADAVMF